jgi:competence protein ComEC
MAEPAEKAQKQQKPDCGGSQMKRLFAAFLLLSLLLSGCTTEKPEAQQESADSLVIHFIDVGHADCTLLTVGETTVLIDGGNTDTSWNVLRYLRRFGIEELDLVVNTHPHGDHLGGIPLVLNSIPTKEVWCSTTSFDTYLFDQFEAAADKQDLEISKPVPGTIYASGGLTITVLGPLEAESTYEDLNDTSLVLMVQYGEKKFLFTGDMEAYAESQLVRSGMNLDVDVLKVGHHGSYSSTSQAFLDKVSPEYGVVFCAWGNEYGHPHDGPMNRLNKADVELFRTDIMGDIVLVTDGSDLAFLLETSDTTLTGYEKPLQTS